MRTIEFRAWDNEAQVMRDSELQSLCLDALVNSDSLDLEQYTGLKDDSDKEIYEGDIIKAEAENDDGSVDGMIGKVSYDNHTASFVLMPLDNDKEMWSFDNLFDEGFCELFCIGNIHEKTELLEEKK